MSTHGSPSRRRKVNLRHSSLHSATCRSLSRTPRLALRPGRLPHCSPSSDRSRLPVVLLVVAVVSLMVVAVVVAAAASRPLVAVVVASLLLAAEVASLLLVVAVVVDQTASSTPSAS